jgi:broad specificity phosphatase PhoE
VTQAGAATSAASGAPPAAGRLLLVRHPQTDWNAETRWQGHADLPLNALGREQAAAAAEALLDRHVAAVYTSDLLRARELADALGGALALRPRVSRRLRERSMGAWEGLTPAEALAAWPGLYPRVEADPFHEDPPGGESFARLLARTRPALAAIARRHAGRTALVVTHGGILKALLCPLLGVPFRDRDALGLGNGVQVLFEVAGPRWTVLKPGELARRQVRDDPDGGFDPEVADAPLR